MKEKKSKKTKVVYVGDTGQTLYSMAALDGKTPEEQEEKKYSVLQRQRAMGYDKGGVCRLRSVASYSRGGVRAHRAAAISVFGLNKSDRSIFDVCFCRFL